MGSLVAFSIFNSCLQKKPYWQIERFAGINWRLVSVLLKEKSKNINREESEGFNLFFKK
jgi:hypothetical protein